MRQRGLVAHTPMTRMACGHDRPRTEEVYRVSREGLYPPREDQKKIQLGIDLCYIYDLDYS